MRDNGSMNTRDTAAALGRVFAELIDGTTGDGGFALNSGDVGLLRSLDKLSAADASRNANGGATIAAHAQHLRYGLSLMNRWAAEGGNPFADAAWDAAWKLSSVDEAAWQDIRKGLGDEARQWLQTIRTARDVGEIEYAGIVASIAHLGYHLGAIRQIARDTRGPAQGTF
jgi:hypothetical protein